jgi:hypothetical protein
VKANQKTLHRQIRSQIQGKRKIHFVATDHEISHGRTITWTLRAKQAPTHIAETWVGTSWIVEVTATGSRDGTLSGHQCVSHQPAHHARSAAATGARPLEH